MTSKIRNYCCPLVIFICWGLAVQAQQNRFEGSIMYEEKSPKSCSMDIAIDSSYQVSGNLLRQIPGGESNHFISGEFNSDDKTIYLREYALNKKDCPIFFQGKVYHLIEDIYTIVGLFKSLDSARCPSGHINVICRNFKFNLYPKKEVKQEIAMSDEQQTAILTKLLSKKLETEANFLQVRANDVIQIKAGEDTLYLKIYDNQKVDGDRVKIVFNEKVVIDNFALSDEHSVFKLLPQKGANLLKIIALNEGKIALNTSKVELYNKTIHEYFINVLYKNQHTQYEINN